MSEQVKLQKGDIVKQKDTPDEYTSPYYRGDCFLYYDFPKRCQTCGKEMKTEEIRNGAKQ